VKHQALSAGIVAALLLNLGISASQAANASFNIPANTTSSTKQSLGNGQTGTVQATGTLTVTSGTVIAIAGTSTSQANQITVTNSGLISAGTGTGGGRDIRDQSGASNTLITNNAGALIQGAGNDVIAINVAGSATTSASVIDIENAGTIQSLDGGGTGSSTNPTAEGNQAINLKVTIGANLVDNRSTGVIWSTAADGIRPGLNGVVHNDGLIFSNAYQGSSSDGVDAQTNTGVLIINGYTTTTPGGTVATYQGPVTGYVGTQSDVAGKTQSMIEGGRHGITGGNTGTGTTTPVYVDSLNPTDPGVYAMTVTNNQGATIQGDNGSGINIDGFGYINASHQSVTNELVTITNSGKITGDGVTGDGDGVDVDGAVILHNTGSIISYNSTEFSEGVTVGGGTIVNGVGGTIEGKTTAGSTGVGRGITIAGVDKGADDSEIPLQSAYAYTDPSTGTLVSPNITNSGLIKGDSESGIAVLGTTGGGLTVTITNTSTGTIEGNNTGVSEETTIASGTYTGQLNGQSLNQGAIELDDTGNTYVINDSGAIVQDNLAGGTAIAMHGASNTLTITGGSASIVGNVSGDTATDSKLFINPGAGNSFSYAYKISNFTVAINSDGSNGTVTLSGASDYSGGTTISGGTTYVNNTSGSGTGVGAVLVQGGATLAGKGTIQPTGANGITLSAGTTVAPGGVQPATSNSANVANGNLALDTTNFTPGAGTTPNSLLTVNGANLTFALGSGDAMSGSKIVVTGGVANTIAFTGTSTARIDDLPGVNLTLGLEYVLISGDDTTFTGLDRGATSSLGTEIIGGLSLANDSFLQSHPGSNLYLVGDSIDVEVAPEPSTWAMLLGGVGVLLWCVRRRRA
jgi:hypothetical protein